MATSNRHGDALLTAVAAVAVTTLIAQHIAGKATRDALFLTYFPVERLPLMMMVSAIVSVAGVLLMSRLLARFGPAKLIPVVFAVSAVLLLLQWRLIDAEPQWATAILYLQISAINSLLISGFWSVINERFDPHSAKRVIARLAAAATFGGLVGGVAAKVVASAADTHAVLLMLALMHVFCGVAVSWIGRGGESSGMVQEKISLFSPLRSSSLLRSMAVLALLVATLAAVLDYVLKAEAAATLDDEQLITFFSYFYVAVGLGGFLLQAAVGNRALGWLGLGGAMLAWPVAILFTGGITLVLRSLLTAALMRGTAAVLYNSFFRTGFEVLYTPIPAEQKRTGKVMIDVGADRAGDLMGGMLVMAVLLLPFAGSSVLLLTALALAVVCAAVILVLQRNYSRQLAENLRSGKLGVEDIKTSDATTLKTLAETQVAMDRDRLLLEIEQHRQQVSPAMPAVASYGPRLTSDGTGKACTDPLIESIADLRSDDLSRVRRVLTSRDLSSSLLPHVVALLRNEDLVRDALQALRPVASRSAGQLIDLLLDPLQPARVRRRIPIVLGYADNELAVTGLLTAIRDRDQDVRFRSAQALERIRRRDSRTHIDAVRVLDAAVAELRALDKVPENATSASDRGLELVFLLIGISDNPETVELCWRALHSSDQQIQGTAVEYLENCLAGDVWQLLSPHLERISTTGPGQNQDETDAAAVLHAAAGRLQKVSVKARNTDEDAN